MHDNATKNVDYISEFFWSRQVPTEQKGLLVSDSTPPIIIMSSMTIERLSSGTMSRSGCTVICASLDPRSARLFSNLFSGNDLYFADTLCIQENA